MSKKKNLPARSGAKSDVPSYLQVPDADLGNDNIDASDIVIPRVKIVQPTSNAAKESIKGIKDGDLYNTLGMESYGNELSFFVLLFWKSRVWFSDDFKLLGTHYLDATTKEEIWFGGQVEQCKTNWDAGKDSFNYMVLPEEDLKQALKTKEIPFPCIFSCISAAMGKARQLNGKITTNAMKRIPIYGQLITMTTVAQKFPKGTAYMPLFSYGRYANQAEFSFMQELHPRCKDLQRRADTHHDIDASDSQGAKGQPAGKAAKGDPLNDDDVPF